MKRKAKGLPIDRKRPWGAAQRVLAVLLLAPLGIAVLLIGIRGWTHLRYRQLIYTVDTAPKRRVAIIFGAAVWPDGRLSPVLADRVQTGVDLYKTGRVEKLLMTGDNRFINYNEPKHMAEYAQAQGVPAENIVLDYAGRRTYDSCYRARHIFGVTDAILVSQAYHLDRALFTARHLGIDAIGVQADRRAYYSLWQWQVRETLATPLAWLEVFLLHPTPILGEKIPIFEE